MRRKWTMAAGMFFLLLFPYIMTLFITGKITEAPEESGESGRTVRFSDAFGPVALDLEEYVVGVAAAQIPGDYEEEAVKAQMIIVRTYLYKAMGDAVSVDSTAFSCEYWSLEDRKENWGDAFAELQEKFARAGKETAGQVMLCEGSLIEPLFHRASAGMTRTAGADFPYLEAVSSSQDVDMENYVTIREFSAAELSAAIGALRGQAVSEAEALGLQIAARDEAGYVQTVLVGTGEYTGDEIAAALALPSPAFSVSQTEKGLKFVAKGSGHGYGLSQWGAHKLAGEGQDAVAVLTYYYKNITIAFFE